MKAESTATKKRACWSGFTYGLGFGVLFYIYALLFLYGAKLEKDGDNTFEEMVTAMITALAISNAFLNAGIFAPDLKHGIEAGKRLMKILDYEPSINVNSKEGVKKEIEGKIEFVNVTFLIQTELIWLRKMLVLFSSLENLLEVYDLLS